MEASPFSRPNLSRNAKKLRVNSFMIADVRNFVKKHKVNSVAKSGKHDIL